MPPKKPILWFTADQRLHKRINDFCLNNSFETQSEAITHLLDRALQGYEKEASEKQVAGDRVIPVEKDRRRYPRAKIEWPVSIHSDRVVSQGITFNISPNGVFIRCRDPLSVYSVFDMVIFAPGEPLKAKGEVAWSNPSGPLEGVTPRGMGIRFLEIADEDQRFIAETTLDYFQKERVTSKALERLHSLLIDKM